MPDMDGICARFDVFGFDAYTHLPVIQTPKPYKTMLIHGPAQPPSPAQFDAFVLPQAQVLLLMHVLTSDILGGMGGDLVLQKCLTSTLVAVTESQAHGPRRGRT